MPEITLDQDEQKYFEEMSKKLEAAGKQATPELLDQFHREYLEKYVAGKDVERGDLANRLGLAKEKYTTEQERLGKLYVERAAEPRPAAPAPPQYSPLTGEHRNSFIVMAAGLLVASMVGPRAAQAGTSASLDALNGALTGLHEGNKLRYEAEMKNYRENVDRIKDNYAQAIREHDRVIALAQHDRDQSYREMDAVTKQYGIVSERMHHTIESFFRQRQRLMETLRTLNQRDRQLSINEKKANQSSKGKKKGAVALPGAPPSSSPTSTIPKPGPNTKRLE